MRAISGILTLVATVIAAIVIGFGVPLAWLYIGSQLQGGSGATSLSFSVAVAILVGIIVSYIGVLYLAGWLMTLLGENHDEGADREDNRRPWQRGMTDTRPARPGETMGAIERVFVVTTIIVIGAAGVWFLFFAEGGGLPNQ